MALTAAQNAAVAKVAAAFSSPTNTASQKAAIANVGSSFSGGSSTSSKSSSGSSGSSSGSGSSGSTPTPPPNMTPAQQAAWNAAVALIPSSNTQTGQGIAYDPTLASRGITQADWNSMNATQQATVAATNNAANSIVSNTGHSVTMSDALNAAATDPTIVSKYADMAAIDKLQLQQTIQQIQTATSTQAQSQQMQMEADRKALATQSAAAGQAYSGFRGKAEQNLATTESGIVTSSRAVLQKSLDDATSAYVSKYGSAAPGAATAASFVNPMNTSNTSISGLTQNSTATPETLTGALPSGITGTAVTNKQLDVNSLAAQYVALGTIPSVKSA